MEGGREMETKIAIPPEILAKWQKMDAELKAGTRACPMMDGQEVSLEICKWICNYGEKLLCHYPKSHAEAQCGHAEVS